jgi:acyl-coenzyme A thioesterase PaaI-like protein
VPLAVTARFNINFLRKPGPCALIAECRPLKLGKRMRGQHPFGRRGCVRRPHHSNLFDPAWADGWLMVS